MLAEVGCGSCSWRKDPDDAFTLDIVLLQSIRNDGQFGHSMQSGHKNNSKMDPFGDGAYSRHGCGECFVFFFYFYRSNLTPSLFDCFID